MAETELEELTARLEKSRKEWAEELKKLDDEISKKREHRQKLISDLKFLETDIPPPLLEEPTLPPTPTRNASDETIPEHIVQSSTDTPESVPAKSDQSTQPPESNTETTNSSDISASVHSSDAKLPAQNPANQNMSTNALNPFKNTPPDQSSASTQALNPFKSNSPDQSSASTQLPNPFKRSSNAGYVNPPNTNKNPFDRKPSIQSPPSSSTSSKTENPFTLQRSSSQSTNHATYQPLPSPHENPFKNLSPKISSDQATSNASPAQNPFKQGGFGSQQHYNSGRRGHRYNY